MSVTGGVGVAEVGTGTGAVTAPVSGVEEKTADIDSQSVAGIASSKEDSQVVASENEGRKNSPVSPQLGASEEDRNFANEARKLLNDLKNIIKNAKQKIHDETGAYSSTDFSEAEKALNETDVTLNQISEGAFSAPASVAVNILA